MKINITTGSVLDDIQAHTEHIQERVLDLEPCREVILDAITGEFAQQRQRIRKDSGKLQRALTIQGASHQRLEIAGQRINFRVTLPYARRQTRGRLRRPDPLAIQRAIVTHILATSPYQGGA